MQADDYHQTCTLAPQTPSFHAVIPSLLYFFRHSYPRSPLSLLVLSELKSSNQQLQAENDRLSRADQEHEIDLETALIEREMAQERAEQADTELDTLRSKLEECEHWWARTGKFITCDSPSHVALGLGLT
jgi:hypothetical protein